MAGTNQPAASSAATRAMQSPQPRNRSGGRKARNSASMCSRVRGMGSPGLQDRPLGLLLPVGYAVNRIPMEDAMFRGEDIQERLRVKPFRPFRIIASEGLRYDIHHP